ncbi:hypothetical protein CCACVL1_26702 [Corchorus capsularis]|uniref:Uncharacterized protein n=1 Tax=Corchorus capsularis TaxID=210143 RepID=A0A1R3GDN0_COCAP|nr:hypothetical protein CCACVL1_26702 [Corchorus capsularis]
MGNGVQGVIPREIKLDLEKKFVVGRVDKIMRFQILECEIGYNTVPLDHIIFFNGRTAFDEISEDVARFPCHHFRFATMEEMKTRHEKSPVLTGEVL